MYQVVGIMTWQTERAGNTAHRKLIPRALDRWEEISPPGALAFISRCSKTKTIFTTLFPISEGVENDQKRKKYQRIVQTVARDFMDDGEFLWLEGNITARRTCECFGIGGGDECSAGLFLKNLPTSTSDPLNPKLAKSGHPKALIDGSALPHKAEQNQDWRQCPVLALCGQGAF